MNILKKTAFVCLGLLASGSCKKDKDFIIENRNENQISVFGHGGMGNGSTYPINTYESILKCLNLGADGTEMDVQLTKDSILVAFKGEELSKKTNCSGKVNSMTWDELSKCVNNEQQYAQYDIVSIETLFEKTENLHDFTFTFDCKLHPSNDFENYIETFTNAIVKLIEEYQLQNNVFIESQNEDFLQSLKNKMPNYKTFIYPASFKQGIEVATALDLYGITISTKNATEENITNAHSLGLTVALWNTHTKQQNIEAVNKNPDFIQTNKVKYLLKVLQ